MQAGLILALLASSSFAQEPLRLQSVKLNGPLTGELDTFRVSPDGRRVVYEDEQGYHGVALEDPGGATQLSPTLPGTPRFLSDVGFTSDSQTVFMTTLSGSVATLYRAPVDGSQAATLLDSEDCPSCLQSYFRQFTPTADDATLVYTYSASGHNFFFSRLYSVPVDGSSPATLLDSGNESSYALELTPDGLTVVFVESDIFGSSYYSVPVDGSASPTRIGPPGIYTGSGFEVASGGSLLVARGYDFDDPNDNILFSVPVDGSAAATILATGVSGYRVAPDDLSVAYVESALGAPTEIHHGPVDGSTTATLLATHTDPVDVVSLVFSPDGSRLVYVADGDVDGQFEVYSVPVDAGQFTVKISGTFVAGGDVSYLDGPPQVTPDGTTVVFRADARVDQTFEIWAAPIEGGGPVRMLHNPLDLGSFWSMGEDFVLLSNSKEILYRGWPNTMRLPVWLARVDQTGPFRMRSGPFEDPTRVQGVREGFQVTPDETHVVFMSNQEDPDQAELYAFPLHAGHRHGARPEATGR